MALAVECLHLLSLGGQLLAGDHGALPRWSLSEWSALPGGKRAWKPLVTACQKQPSSMRTGQKAWSCLPGFLLLLRESCAAIFVTSASWHLPTFSVHTEAARNGGKEEASTVLLPGLRL